MATAPTLPATPADPAEPATGGDDLARGTVFGRYVILDAIGEGGMGKVFAAHDASLDRNIALKIVLHAPDRESQARLIREAKAMARVPHPAIVAVHDVGSVGARVYIAMELVRGTTLRGWLAEPRSWRAIVQMFVAAGRGLEAAHAAGVIHRDFKPENVLVDEAGRVRVSDFGLAELRAALAHSASPSAGTPIYMAPEQYARRTLDERTDQFSFCVALWQAVYGEHPFADRDDERTEAVVAGRLRRPTDRGPRMIANVLRRGLATEPDARYPSMTPLLAALERALARRRLRVIVPLAVAAIAAVATGAIVRGAASSRGPACDVASAQATWTPMRRGIVASELGSDNGRALGALDDYARAWGDERVEACRATHVLGKQSGELLDLRMECLDRRLGELDALVTALASGAPGVAASAPSAIAGLVPLTACADATALRDVVPLPAAPATRARVVAVRAVADRVSADFDTGKLAAGYATVGPLVREAEATAYAPVIAEVELLHGKLAWRTDHMDIAEAALYHSIASAEAGRDGATAAAAWLSLLQFTSQERGNLAEARRLGRLAQGAIDRYAGDPALVSGLAEQLGWIELDLDHPDAAEPLLQRAYDLRHARLRDDDPAIAASLQSLALVATARGDHATAIDRHRRALAILTKARGPDHPDTLAEVNSFAAALYEAGKLDDALAMYRDGFARVTRTLGADGLDAGMYQHNIALVLSRQGQHAEALASQRRALEIVTRVRGRDATDTVDQHVDLGRMLRVAHQLPAAIAEYRAALPEVELAYGHDSISVAVTLEGLSRALIDAGHKRDAIEPLQRALAIREHGQAPAATQKARDELAEAMR